MAFKILVPTDFSFTAEKALNYALNIASKNDGTVALFNVFTPIENLMAVPEDLRIAYNLRNEDESIEALRAIRKQSQAVYPNVDVSVSLGTSPLVHAILEFAADNDIDLIVMGTQGASGFKEAIIGSNATEVLKRSNVPVLLVPGEFNWTPPKKIVVATNYENQDVAALTIAGQLASFFAASVKIVHLTEDYTPGEYTAFANYVADLKPKFPSIHLSSALLPSASNTLECLHESEPYDLLVMVKRKMSLVEHLFDPSQTKRVACLSQYPLMVVPAKE